MIPVPRSDGPFDPFGSLGLDLSDSELRETAYEIFVAAFRSPGGGKPLSFVSRSPAKVPEKAPPGPSLQRSLTFTTVSKVKRSLGINSPKKKKGSGSAPTSPSSKENRPAAIGETMRVQMKISEQTDSRFKSADFPTQHEYEEWQKRNLKILEAGLLLHPKIPLGKNNSSARQLSEIIHEAYECPMVTGKHSEEVKTLRGVVKSLASRSFDTDDSDMCHWADGIPLNLRLYQLLLEALFEIDDPTVIVDEVDEILEYIKKTWGILGLDEKIHKLCFLWVLFNRYIATGQVEKDLLFACGNLLLDIKEDAGFAGFDSKYSKILKSTLILILDWAEKGLLAYREFFYRGNIDLMHIILSIALSAAEMVAEECPCDHGTWKTNNVASAKVDTYIRSSMRKAFNQLRLSRRPAKRPQAHFNQLPALCVIAQEITDLAFTEKEIYCPILEKWHPLAVGVAVATLHSCFRQEVKAFISGINDLTPDVIQVLIMADKLEKCLVQMAVEDSFNSEDGGKSIIQEMDPYEAEAVIADLVKSWIQTRVLRTIGDTLEAFFLLPIPMHAALLPDLTNGLDRSLQDYISKAKSGLGTRSSFLPKVPSMTRYSGESKTNGVFDQSDESQVEDQKSSKQGDDSCGIPQLCVRINTFLYVRKELEVLEKRVIAQLRSTGPTEGSIVNDYRISFKRSLAACVDGIQDLCEITAYKVVFHELNHVFWDGLYVDEASASRIEPFLQELQQNLEKIAEIIQEDTVKTRVITDIMRASYDGFLLVLLAGGPSRNFTREDSAIIKEDFNLLVDLFWSHGDGLPTDLINKFSATAERILPLFSTDTESLIEQFKYLTADNNGRLTEPTALTSGQWDPTEPDTILRVLCHRNDKAASKFLKNRPC
ncbi:Mammalian uncoordinated homology 13, domain 2 [Cynara cardunculus var. scolymus]|uniref:Mammalian uncoordinated homology 13, domain 2 n=1 Tax=Cynara cardunculus var. scolymus TaxID=59895 RepID=A0A103Y2B3_CYNCS|nr:Mammalian uncoordinated homology 13, domain 2 [Cynara cardunculus var. scolymus]